MAKQEIPPTRNSLELRKRLKKKKPNFARQESWRYKRLKKNWRRPKGLDNKVRRKIKGWPPSVSTGYRGPKITRGMHPSGFQEVLTHNAEKLEEIDRKTHAIRIARTVGKRKRVKILVEARKRKIRVLNLKEAKEKAEEEKELLEEREDEEKPEKEQITEKKKTKRPRRKARKPKGSAETR
ncbi:MAG: 50S ribosomal protein L32e [Candidatus Bathyarchaeota archaeon]|nr:50S ribosomal protein L32e [Candidatus Bathyarchaeota archaeon]MDH5788049.1 50S ribosomal protein L32e [Candidatus Bathyarchaeota archaeon]